MFLPFLHRTSVMKLVFLLLTNLFISSVTTFNPLEWMKDVVQYEHCGSIWIKPDIHGNYNFVSNKETWNEDGRGVVPWQIIRPSLPCKDNNWIILVRRPVYAL